MEKAELLAKFFILMMKDMPVEERQKFIELVGEGYCPSCCYPQPDRGTCQCENDE